MMKSRKILCSSVLLTMFLTLPLSVNPVLTEEEPRYGGTLIAQWKSEPDNLNPIINTGVAVHSIASKIYGCIVEHDNELNPVPSLAESWSVSADGKTIQFNLVKNATWEDGEPFTSADVKYSMELAGNITSATMMISVYVKSIETPDPYTVVVTLSASIPFLLFAGFNYFPIIPKHVYEGTDIFENPANVEPVAIGPFKFEEWVRGDHITLVRNERYWKKGKPYLNRIVCRFIPDYTAQILALETGELDVSHNLVLPIDIERLESQGIIITGMGREAQGSSIYIGFNLRSGPWSDVRVRRAIAHSINRTLFRQLVSMDFLPECDSFIIASNPEEYQTTDYPKYPYNLTKAEELLDEAGYPRGAGNIRFTMRMLADIGDFGYTKTAEILKDQLLKVGIQVDLSLVSASASDSAAMLRWDFDTQIRSENIHGPEPIFTFPRYFHSSNIQKVKHVNYFGYNSTQFDDASSKAIEDVENRAKWVKEMNRILLEDLPVIPVLVRLKALPYNSDFSFPFYDGWACRETWDKVWWKLGMEISPEAALDDIQNAEKKIKGLKGLFYSVGDALAKLEEAKEAYDRGDWQSASMLALEAPRLAVPPYALYGGVVIAVIAIVAGIFYWRKRRARAKSSPKPY